MHLKYIPMKHNNLHDLNWKKIYDSEHNPNMATQESFGAKFHSALSRLRNTREISLLPALSFGLKENASNHVITMQFHMICMTLVPKHGLKESAVPKSHWSHKVSSFSTHKNKEGTTKFEYLRSSPIRKKRKMFERKRRYESCQDLRSDPNVDDCLGMCGPGCSCWSFVCDDCCYNQLCFEHDKCCRYEMFSVSCLLPFLYRLSCENGFGGYPSCLN